MALTAAAALLGLSPMGCEKSDPKPAPPSDSAGVAEPEYGVPDTHPVDPGTPVQPDGQEPDAPVQPDSQDPDTPAKPDGQDPDAPAEPDEGPDFAPEYGVPATGDEVPKRPIGVPQGDAN